ncbi:MAG: O-antigen ligase family protein [Candidatus Nanopelagicales bacterium]
MTTLLPLLIAGVLALAIGAVLLERPEWAVVGLCLASPVGLLYIGAAQVITVVAIGVIAVMIGSRWSAGKQPFPPIALSGAILFWTVTVLLSIALSPYRADAALFGLWLIVSGLLALSVPGIADSSERLRPIIYAWLISAIAIVVVGPFIKAPTPAQEGEVSAAYGGAVIVGRATSVFGQPNEYGVYCMMMLLVAIAVLVRGKGWLRWVALAAAVATATGLIQSYSRGAWVGAIAGLIVLVVIDPRARKPVLGGALAGGLALTAYAAVAPSDPAVELVVSRFNSIMNPASNPADDRPAIVAEGVRQFGAFPWFGVGPNAYPLEGSTSRSLEQTVGGLHAHNTVLTVAAEQGLFGVAAMLAIMAVVVVTCVPMLPVVMGRKGMGWPSENDWVAAVLVGTIAALSAIMVSGMVDSPLRNALMRTTLWFTIGVAVAAGEILRRAAVNPPDILQTGDPRSLEQSNRSGNSP